MTEESRHDIRWSPRVPKWRLRRLYLLVAQGIWDIELIDDVGMTLYMRCRDIQRIYRAKRERLVTCPRCDRVGIESLIPRREGQDEQLTCPKCGWALTWRSYRRAFRRRQLNPGGAVEAFGAFMTAFEQASDPKAKMMAIDQVVHTFHYSLVGEPDRPTRAAGVNLISGKLADVVCFLDELGNLDLPVSLQRTHALWAENHGLTYWHGLVDQGDG